MRRSREVPLTLLAAAAAVSIGCHSGPQQCVDGQNHLMPDSYCEEHGSGGGGHGGGYHYIRGGSSGGHFGDVVVGGSSGGFGSIFGGFGHGGGGEGGE